MVEEYDLLAGDALKASKSIAPQFGELVEDRLRCLHLFADRELNDRDQVHRMELSPTSCSLRRACLGRDSVSWDNLKSYNKRLSKYASSLQAACDRLNKVQTEE